MAAGMARKVFGPSHNIVSAGAETAPGLPAAGNAIMAMAETGVDISGHATTDVEAVDLASFDLVVVFRPSAANSISLPEACEVDYFDIADPYGGSLDTYRETARLIRRAVRALYAKDVLRRVQGGAAGSHAQGMFNRAARAFEEEIADFVKRDLNVTVGKKPTLGQLGTSVGQYAAIHSDGLLHSLAEAISGANAMWVRVKHRDDPALEDLTAGLVNILEGLRLVSDRVHPTAAAGLRSRLESVSCGRRG